MFIDTSLKGVEVNINGSHAILTGRVKFRPKGMKEIDTFTKYEKTVMRGSVLWQVMFDRWIGHKLPVYNWVPVDQIQLERSS